MKRYKWNLKNCASFLHLPKLTLLLSILIALGVSMPLNVDAQRGGGGRGVGGRSSVNTGGMSRSSGISRGGMNYGGMSRSGSFNRMNSTRSNQGNYVHRYHSGERFNRGYRGLPYWRYYNYPYWGEYYWGMPPYDFWFLYNGYNYYNNSGVYYRYDDDKYQVVAAPIGYRVKDLPKGSQQFVLDGVTYYYYFGSYYTMLKGKFEVVEAPLGALVESIPDGFDKVMIDGQTYYTLNGVQYKAVLQNNEVWYQVIKNNGNVVASKSTKEVQPIKIDTLGNNE